MPDLRALIVDDEPPAIRRLRSLLAGERDVEIVGECSDGESAVAAIRRLEPDVVFLDVQMPELDGFGVVERLRDRLPERVRDHLPVIVFVTAHDEHAIEAFEVEALDYLLKPIDRARFGASLERARTEVARRRGSPSSDPRISRLIARLAGEPRASDRLAIRAHGRIRLVPVAEIEWIEAVGKHVRIHAAGGASLVREPMRSIEARLDPRRFVRIHRSALVNVDGIRDLEPTERGDYRVRLASGTELALGRSYKDEVCRRLGVR